MDKMKKYLKSFSITADEGEESINMLLELRGVTAEDVISITFYHSGQYQSYTVWYRSAKK